MTLLPVLLAVTFLAQTPQQVKIPVTGGQLSYLHSTPPDKRAPLLVALPPDTSEQLVTQTFRAWEKIGGATGWLIVTPAVAGAGDAAAKALDLILDDVFQRLPVDTARVYLAGAGTPDVFYYVSRLPDRFAAALSIQGNPTQAVNSNRLFGANTELCPTLWVEPPAAFDMQRSKMAAAGFRLEERGALKDAQIFEWLAGHARDANPPHIDCESGNPAFGRCHWIEMTRFNPKLRNDVLSSTRVNPGSG
ncbi:MAG: hypothetical protein ACREMQ_07025, partial [Longimicrobiales bacterium]